MAGSYVFFIVYWLCILMLYTGGKDMEGSQIITLVVAMIGVIGTFVVDIRQSKKNTAGLKNDHEKISIRMEDSQRALVSGITDIKRTQIAQDSKISSVSNEVSRQAEMRSTVMRNGVNIDKVLSEVSALGGIVDTYEIELEEYKKQVFELMKQNGRLSFENQKLSEEIILLKNQSRGRDIGLDDQDLDYGER